MTYINKQMQNNVMGFVPHASFAQQQRSRHSKSVSSGRRSGELNEVFLCQMLHNRFNLPIAEVSTEWDVRL
jgi:hypothetical protein